MVGPGVHQCEPHLCHELWKGAQEHHVELMFLSRYTTPILMALDQMPHAMLKQMLGDGFDKLHKVLKTGQHNTYFNILPALCYGIVNGIAAENNKTGFKRCGDVPMGS